MKEGDSIRACGRLDKEGEVVNYEDLRNIIPDRSYPGRKWGLRRFEK